jgi:hypothetical protein
LIDPIANCHGYHETRDELKERKAWRRERKEDGEAEDEDGADEEAYNLRGIDTSTHDLQANLKKWSSVRSGSETTVLCVCLCERVRE